jgi:two-component system response regulator MprA
VQILVVDDDPGVRQAVRRALQLESYDVAVAEDGVEALRAVGESPPDAIVLDVMMPRLDGVEVCRELRARGDKTPILVLTAKHRLTDRVAGLDAGADDYLVKPFALEELLARLRALLRRVVPEADTRPRVLGDLVLDPKAHTVHRADREISLTRTEFALLDLLLSNAGQVLTRGVIMDRIWGYDFATTSNSLDVYIGYLRRKTEAEGEPRLIQTVRGVGYVARLPTAA